MTRNPLQPLPRRRARASGFTLVEVLVTMVMMAIVIPVVMRGISLGVNAASVARHEVEAAQLADELLSEMTSTLIQQETFSFGTTGDFGADYPGYTWELQTSDDTELGVQTLVLAVSWADRGQKRTLLFSTMVAEPLDTSTLGTTTP